ncbi:ABC-type multidrug transport system ATPase subunit [Marmoricola sp. URHA0025 HA25]
MIRTTSLTKRFGPILAVDDLDLDVREGDIFGFLGANGSGKTTTVRMVLGLVLPTSGSVRLLDRPMPSAAREVLPDVGALVEGPAAYGQLGGRVNLGLLDAAGPARGRRSARKRRIEEALDRVGLGGVDNRPVRAYSLGMRQRLGLAAAILRTPRLLVLDEPTNGLDPQGIREIRTLVRELHAGGTTVLLLSHQLAEVEQLCSRVGVLDRGRLVLQDDMADVCGPTGRVHLHTRDVDRARSLLDGQVEGRTAQGLVVRHPDPAELNALLVRGGVRIDALTPEVRTLEDAVLEATSAGADRIERS